MIFDNVMLVFLFILFALQAQNIKELKEKFENEDDKDDKDEEKDLVQKTIAQMKSDIHNLESETKNLKKEVSSHKIKKDKYIESVSELVDSLLTLSPSTTIDHVFKKYDVFYDPYFENGKLNTFTCKFIHLENMLRIFVDVERHKIDIYDNNAIVFAASFQNTKNDNQFEVDKIIKGRWYFQVLGINEEFRNSKHERYTRAG